MSRGRNNSPPPLDEFDLELAVLRGDGPAETGMEMDEELAPLRAEILKFQRAWIHAPPLPASLPEAVPQARRGPGIRRWAAAAAVVLLVGSAVGLGILSEPNGPESVQPKGVLPVELLVERDGRYLEPVAGDFRAGDRLGLAVRVPRRAWVAVALVGADGRSDLLWTSPVDGPVEAGERFELDGSIELDDNPYKEWLVLSLAPGPVDPAVLQGQLSKTRDSRPSDSTWFFDVSRTEQ